MSPSHRSRHGKSSYSPLWFLAPLIVTASMLLAIVWIECFEVPPLTATSVPSDDPDQVEADHRIADEVTEGVRRFALNAFLVPVLDTESSPTRWRDPSLAVPCLPGSQVHVDGRPIEPDSEVLGQEFSVLWAMESCLPLGTGGPEFTGEAEVVGVRDDEGLSAIVHFRKLHVRHRGQQLVLDTTFVARTP
jgi:hypothetical protein